MICYKCNQTMLELEYIFKCPVCNKRLPKKSKKRPTLLSDKKQVE